MCDLSKVMHRKVLGVQAWMIKPRYMLAVTVFFFLTFPFYLLLCMYMIMGSKIKTGNKIRFCAVRLHSVTVLSQQCPVYVQFYNLFGLRD